MSAENLKWARALLRDVLERHDPKWLKRPKGALKIHWNSGGRSPACFLIELAGLLNGAQRNVTRRSLSRVIVKAKQLFHAEGRQFEERLAEFQFLGQLGQRASPIAVDPLVPEEKFDTPREPSSPDFAVRLPDGDVFFELTVVRFGALDEWDKRARRFGDQLQREILNRGLRRTVHLKLPLSLRQADLPNAAARQLVEAIVATESGEWSTGVDGSHARVRWEPVPHVTTMDALNDSTFPKSATFCTVGPPGMPAAGVSHELLLNEDADELLVKSVRNTLRRKREQFPHDAEYVLVIKLGHHRLAAAGVQRMLHQRIFPNPDYQWLTGVCLFAPQENFEIGTPPPSLILSMNENATVHASQSLIDLFEGRRQFHLP